MGRVKNWTIVLLGAAVTGSVSAASLGTPAQDGERRTGEASSPARVDVVKQVLPLLKARCFSCHTEGSAQGKLRLDSRAAILKGGASGPALHPGKSDDSELIRRVTSRDPSKIMPLGAPPLTPAEVTLLRAWIDAGAPWPASGIKGAEGGGSTVHWSFVPPRKPPVPQVKYRNWVLNPVDAFVLAEMEKKGLSPSPAADRATLLRRLTLDLTGLPPTPEEVRAFLDDRAPDAYDRVVRRLLDSPRYGERWAQHWLDVVRFAETNGFEGDADRPQAWRYRDYVVRSLNEDKPYNRFITEQIAGDEIDPENFDLRVATGFLRAGPAHVFGGNVNPAEQRQEWLTEAVAGVGAGVLGLTINCARCHDHKFDPIPQKDFYRLQAFFAGTANQNFERHQAEEKEAHAAAVRAHQARLRPIQAEIGALEKPYRERLRKLKYEALEPAYRVALDTPEKMRTADQKRLATDAQKMLGIAWDELVAALTPEDRRRRADLRKQMHTLNLHAPAPLPMAPGVGETLSPVPPTHVLLRGDLHTPGPKVDPGFPTALVAGMGTPAVIVPTAAGAAQEGRRTQLAAWLTRPDHPLTARVLVNRVWQHHFGRGLVGTPNDFGRHGEKPTHPELLDYLASVFTNAGTVNLTQGGEGEGDKGVKAPFAAATAGYTGSSFILHPSSFIQASPKPPTPSPAEGMGWSLKKLHYLLVTSNTYKQASASHPQKAEIDPDNRWLWRMNRRRLDGEAIRDAVLHTAGTLNPDMGGPAVRVPLEPEVYAQIFTEGEPDNLWPVTPDEDQHRRRSLYLLRKRNVRLPMLAVFDAPDMMSSCGARGQSVHALQALTLMNGEFMTAQSRALARRVLTEEPGDVRGRIERLYTLTLARPPQPRELAATERFLADQAQILRERRKRGAAIARLDGIPTEIDPVEAAAWADLSLAVLNLNEFVYVR